MFMLYGTDTVMLSRETAAGRFPCEARALKKQIIIRNMLIPVKQNSYTHLRVLLVIIARGILAYMVKKLCWLSLLSPASLEIRYPL
jgi:hypothetical protein